MATNTHRMVSYDNVLPALGIKKQESRAPSAIHPRNTPAKCALLELPARRVVPAPKAIQSDVSEYARQPDCLLFSKLPVEIRNAIWEMLLGHHTIHVFWHDRDTLRSFICTQQAGGPRECISMQHGASRAKEFIWSSASHICERSSIDQKKGFMPLLLTCRAVYFEAIRSLYATNTFDFTDHWRSFHTRILFSIPLRSINHITHMTIVAHGVPLPTTALPVDLAAWIKLWDALALFQALRCLVVDLVPRKGRCLDKRPIGDALSAAANEFLTPVLKMNALVGKTVRGRTKWILKVPSEVRMSARELVGVLEGVGWSIIAV